MMNKLDIKAGDRYGKLSIIREVEPDQDNTRNVRRKFMCQCDCGNTLIVRLSNLRNGITSSCGCENYGKENIAGKKFGRLTAVKYIPEKTVWLCQCDCGNTKEVPYTRLRRGYTKSCGCQLKDHAVNLNMKYSKEMTSSRLYGIWRGIKMRCYSTSSNEFMQYGGRGIKMCDEWRTDFTSFYNWAINNGYSDHLTIDRIDNNGDYEPSNCRWATKCQQMNNRRVNVYLEYKGIRHTATEWSRILGFGNGVLISRKNMGWSDEKSLTTPPQKRKGKIPSYRQGILDTLEKIKQCE